MEWLKQNLKAELIPHRTHGNTNVANQNPVEKDLSTASNYQQQSKGSFPTDVTLSDLK